MIYWYGSLASSFTYLRRVKLSRRLQRHLRVDKLSNTLNWNIQNKRGTQFVNIYRYRKELCPEVCWYSVHVRKINGIFAVVNSMQFLLVCGGTLNSLTFPGWMRCCGGPDSSSAGGGAGGAWLPRPPLIVFSRVPPFECALGSCTLKRTSWNKGPTIEQPLWPTTLPWSDIPGGPRLPIVPIPIEPLGTCGCWCEWPCPCECPCSLGGPTVLPPPLGGLFCCCALSTWAFFCSAAIFWIAIKRCLRICIRLAM